MDILSEVQQEHSASKQILFIKMLLLCAVVAALLMVTYFSISNYQNNKKLDTASRYNEALQMPTAKIKQSLELLVNEDNIYGILSTLKLANTYIAEGNFKEAAKYFRVIAKRSSIPSIYMEYAGIKEIKSLLIGDLITNHNALKRLKEHSKFFGVHGHFSNLSDVMAGVLMIKEKEYKNALETLNYVMVSNESSRFLVDIAKVLQNIIQVYQEM